MILNSYEAKTELTQTTIDIIESKWAKVHSFVKSGELREAESSLYLLLHSREMFSYWKKLCGSDKIPQIWSYVSKFSFNPNEQTASINLKNGSVTFGPTFFSEQLPKLEDAMFLVLHERNHSILRKLWYSELSLTTRRNSEHLLPTRLPNIIFNFFEDAYINPSSRKIVFSSVPEQYYSNAGSITKLLSGDIAGTIKFFTNVLKINVPTNPSGHWSMGSYSSWGGAPIQDIVTQTSLLLRKYVAMYCTSDFLTQKLNLDVVMSMNNIDRGLRYYYPSYVEWMRVGSDWYNILDPQRKALVDANLSVLPIIGGSSHVEIAAPLHESTREVKKANVKLPLGMTAETAKAELRRLYDLHNKKKELERKIREQQDAELEQRIAADKLKMNKPQDSSIKEEHDEISDDDLEERIAKDLQELKPQDDDSEESSEPKPDFETLEDEDEEVGADDPDEDSSDSLYYEEVISETELNNSIQDLDSEMESISKQFGIDLSEYNGSRLFESSELGSNEPAYDSYGMPTNAKLIKAYSYESYIFPNSWKKRMTLVRATRLNEFAPDGFEMQMMLNTTEPSEIDLPRSLQTGVFNKFNQSVVKEIVGEILSKRVTETFHQGQVLIPPNEIARRDLFWLASGYTPYFFTTRYSTTKRNVSLYSDVSGSMTEYLPYLPYFAKRLAEYAGSSYHFSDVVVEVDPFEPAYYSTGGTRFNQVAMHMLEHEVKSAIIISDGEDDLDPVLYDKLKNQLEECYYLKVGWNPYGKDRYNDFTKLATRVFPLFSYQPTEEELKDIGIDPETLKVDDV